jgi:cytochrome c-type biogenesis protein CcmH
MKHVLALVLLLASLSSALAVQPDEMLKDAGLEERARNISTGLRCLVCQNQSIDDYNATMARDLRILIREQLVEGKSDSEVVDFVVARYGDFVLLKPRFKGATIVLWLAPFVILGLVLVIAVRKRARPAADPLSEAEKAEIAALIDDKSVPTAKSPQT